MVKARYFFACFFLLKSFVLFSQIPGVGGGQVYGNEWINYENEYHRFLIAEDGWYSIDFSALVNSGVEPEEIIGSNIRVYHNGIQVPLVVSTNDLFGENDNILFYGVKNRSELEGFMFKNPENQLLNPMYSMFTDSSAYFLTFTSEGTGVRFENAGNLSANGNSTDRILVKKNIVSSSAFYSEAPSAVINPDFNDLEGFSGAFNQEVSKTLEINPEEVVGDSIHLQIRTAADLRTREFDLLINGNVIRHVENENVQLARNLEYSLPVQAINGPIEISVKCEKGSEKVSIPFVQATFLVVSDQFGVDQFQTFEIEEESNSSLELSLPLTMNNYIYDIKSGVRYPINNSDQTSKAVVQNTENAIFSVPMNIKPVSAMENHQFEDYFSSEFNYLIISNSVLRQQEESDPVQEYANYRSSEQGGGYKVLIADINQLRDQFIFGVELHPFAIKNFIDKLLSENKAPQFVNIIGKGINYGALRSAENYKRFVNTSHFVPTFGYYGSDNLLVAEQWNPSPRIAIGRIPATTSEEVRNYLQKVKNYEMVQADPGSESDRSWMKKILHFNGGDRSIYANIANFMDGIGKDIVQDTFAADLVSYYKSSFGTTDSPEREEIFQQINEGAAMITFLGHSASSSLDFEIDDITEYENEGKLPIFMALGCSSGNIFLTNVNLSERFVLAPGKGSIMFLSTASSQYLTNLQKLARIFYGKLGGDEYGMPVGKILKSTHEEMGRPQDQLISIFTFCGDPAISAYHSDGPDFRFSATEYEVEPKRPSLLDDYLSMTFNIENLGRKFTDSVPVLIEQQLPSGERITIDTTKVLVNNYKKEFNVRIPMRDDMEGSNIFYLKADPNNSINEYPSGIAEQNNELVFPGQIGLEVYVSNSSMQLVYPYNNSIIPMPSPSFQIFNGNIEEEARTYVIEIDTVPTFNSGGGITRERTTVLAKVEIDPEVDFDENVVYFWRAKIKGDSIYTSINSFIYIDGQTGWNQSHYGQFVRDSLVQLGVENGIWDFDNLENTVTVFHGNRKPAVAYNEVGGPVLARGVSPGFNVSIFKPQKNDFVENPYPGRYNSVHTIARDGILKTFPYRPQNKNHRISMLELIDMEADEGDIVIFWNTTNGGTDPMGQQWAQDSIENNGVNIFNFFESKGASQIRELASDDRRTYSFIYEEGGSVISEVLLDAQTRTILDFTLSANLTNGKVNSREVHSLKSISKVQTRSGLKGKDSIHFDLKVEGEVNNDQFSWNDIGYQEDLSLSNIESFELEASLFDEDIRTAPEIDFWRVFGSYKPDLYLSNANELPIVNKDELKAGEINSTFIVNTEGDIEGDSIAVLYEIIGQRFNWTKIAKIGIDEIEIIKEVSFPVPENLSSDFIFKITVDPDNEYNEVNENNNSILSVVDIDQDQIAPKLEVLFDNQVILNGDIVSPKAKIVAEIVDLVNYNLADPPSYTFEIRDPSGDITSLEETDPQFELVREDDKVQLIYHSSFTENGIYELSVNARDAANNRENVDYTVNFEVITESSISQILPYPNPFTTSMRFAYTLTGAIEPEIFRIMIYTPNGRLVREITKAEFGPMRTGRHLSDYVWDGKDEHHQELAPGVYLYKVISRDSEGENYKKYNISELENGGYFKNNIGKIVKLR
ncbi:C25 family cysteine peptidase [Membranihabitans maritimus]|uniref:putative type IX secretion system sortase PorU2 n=1 Tax=Membranihabitans maritimus TaxID=2904244 RepID=UPI001F02DA31|nr:C25 family cysteine peptidase [Membranihabitans maritimus]